MEPSSHRGQNTSRWGRQRRAGCGGSERPGGEQSVALVASHGKSGCVRGLGYCYSLRFSAMTGKRASTTRGSGGASGRGAPSGSK